MIELINVSICYSESAFPRLSRAVSLSCRIFGDIRENGNVFATREAYKHPFDGLFRNGPALSQLEDLAFSCGLGEFPLEAHFC